MLKDKFNHEIEGGKLMNEKTRKQKNIMQKAYIFVKVMIDGFDYHRKNSVHYNQDTWLKQTKRVGGRDIKRRQFNYDSKAQEIEGNIKKYSRSRKDEEKGYIFKSTAYYLTSKGWLLAAHFKIIKWTRAYMMIAAIKAGAQSKINQVKEWVTPDFMIEYYTNLKTPLLDPGG